MNVISKKKSQRLFTLFIPCVVTIDLKTDNLDRVFIPTKIVATFDVEHPILGLAQNGANCSDTGIEHRMHALFTHHVHTP